MLLRSGLPLIADIKLNDIESTNLDAVELLFADGVDAVIANPFVGVRGGSLEGHRQGAVSWTRA